MKISYDDNPVHTRKVMACIDSANNLCLRPGEPMRDQHDQVAGHLYVDEFGDAWACIVDFDEEATRAKQVFYEGDTLTITF